MRLKLLLTILPIACIATLSNAQAVKGYRNVGNKADSIRIEFDAAYGCKPTGKTSLTLATKVYFHSGAGKTTFWEKIVGNPGQDDGVGQMTNAGNGKWTINMNLKTYYNYLATDTVKFIGAYFRNGDSSGEGKDSLNACGDFLLTVDSFTRLSVGINQNIISLSSVYPNPVSVSDEVTIHYTTLMQSDVTVKIFDILGNEVATLVNDRLDAGNHTALWLAKVASGNYFYKIQSGESFKIGKLVVK